MGTAIESGRSNVKITLSEEFKNKKLWAKMVGGTYNFNFYLIKRIVEPLVGDSDYLGYPPSGEASLFQIVTFRIAQYLGCL